MATLQSARLGATFISNSRLKAPTRHQTAPLTLVPKPPEEPAQPAQTHAAVTAEIPAVRPAHRLSEMEHRKLMLQVVSGYPGWLLVSIQRRPESDTLVAYLVQNRDRAEPAQAIRDGRAIQIVMDGDGDLRIQRSHHRPGLLERLARWLHIGANRHQTAPALASGDNIKL